MATDATIVFSRTGVQPPVYVTTSLSGWAPLEMDAEEDETRPGNLIFTKTFKHVAQGSYQYKIRLGEHDWILDESKETAADDQGIHNNVIHVEPASDAEPATSIPDATHEPVSKPVDNRKDSTMDQDQLPSVPVPSVVVDKTDERAADASPHKLNSAPKHHVEPGTDEEQAAPLFRHESFQANEPPPVPSMDTIEEESTQSSADHTSSGDAMDTPSELDEGDELHLAPLLSHETGIRDRNNDMAGRPPFPLQAESDGEDAEHAPLFSHETGLHDDSGIATDSEGGDELDRYPLLSHESGFSDYRGSEMVTKSDYPAEEEPQHYGSYGDDGSDDYPEGHDDDDAPLLPHERKAAVPDKPGSDYSQDDVPFSLEKEPTFGYETNGARNLFSGPGRHDMWRTRTNSNLPHRMPRTDAEDEDLNDPSLERFPTNRDLIFERVASIGVSLPEDDSTHERPNSPQSSVLSQACSSVDLVPVKSYASLASVPEADDSDEDDEENRDVDSLPSPVYIGRKVTRIPSSPSGPARVPYATPIPGVNKQLVHVMQTKDESEEHTRESSSEAESVNKHDGAKDGPHVANAFGDAISTPTQVISSATSPVRSEFMTTTEAADHVANLDSGLRQRRDLVEESSRKADVNSPTISDTTATIKDKATKPPSSSALAHQPDNNNNNNKDDDNLLQYFFRIVFGSLHNHFSPVYPFSGPARAFRLYDDMMDNE
ncbi:hypothetical protein DDE83_004473 [Stemphylium lycopersici]|uniref:AMP-activated protein kinase glycogen-binding domain-containing protein n=1 Tax=Stemphylium lycopersici TaxID=183478 RepID=A0A364N4N0_STELY|nr:hypothetical protein DDE83_004473 [Stemphylium lycopersici]